MGGQVFFFLCRAGTGGRINALDIYRNAFNPAILQIAVIPSGHTAIAVPSRGSTVLYDFPICKNTVLYHSAILVFPSYAAQILIIVESFKGQAACRYVLYHCCRL